MKRSGFGPRTTPLVRNTELDSRSELSRSPIPRASAPGRVGRTATPQQRARKLQLATWAEVKEAAHQRDGWRCVGCGTDRDLDCQHRANKGMGGSKLLDTIANALTLCRTCHRFADQHKNSEGAARGWTVPVGTDPATWPILAYDGVLYLHGDDGERRRIG